MINRLLKLKPMLRAEKKKRDIFNRCVLRDRPSLIYALAEKVAADTLVDLSKRSIENWELRYQSSDGWHADTI